MSITLDLEPDIERDLLAQAQAKGVPLTDYVHQIISRAVQTPPASQVHTELEAKNLLELFANSPFKGLNIDFPRDRDYGREVNL